MSVMVNTDSNLQSTSTSPSQEQLDAPSDPNLRERRQSVVRRKRRDSEERRNTQSIPKGLFDKGSRTSTNDTIITTTTTMTTTTTTTTTVTATPKTDSRRSDEEENPDTDGTRGIQRRTSGRSLANLFRQGSLNSTTPAPPSQMTGKMFPNNRRKRNSDQRNSESELVTSNRGKIGNGSIVGGLIGSGGFGNLSNSQSGRAVLSRRTQSLGYSTRNEDDENSSTNSNNNKLKNSNDINNSYYDENEFDVQNAPMNEPYVRTTSTLKRHVNKQSKTNIDNNGSNNNNNNNNNNTNDNNTESDSDNDSVISEEERHIAKIMKVFLDKRRMRNPLLEKCRKKSTAEIESELTSAWQEYFANEKTTNNSNEKIKEYLEICNTLEQEIASTKLSIKNLTEKNDEISWKISQKKQNFYGIVLTVEYLLNALEVETTFMNFLENTLDNKIMNAFDTFLKKSPLSETTLSTRIPAHIPKMTKKHDAARFPTGVLGGFFLNSGYSHSSATPVSFLSPHRFRSDADAPAYSPTQLTANTTLTILPPVPTITPDLPPQLAEALGIPSQPVGNRTDFVTRCVVLNAKGVELDEDEMGHNATMDVIYEDEGDTKDAREKKKIAKERNFQ